MGEAAAQMRDHWWWRPGGEWGDRSTPGITFDDQPAVHQLADGYASALDGLPILDPVPPPWLHSAEVTVDHVSLIDLDRDQQAYVWADVATAALGRW